MQLMIVRMSAIVAAHVALTFLLYRKCKDQKLTAAQRCIIGVIYGLCAVLSNHFSVRYEHSLLNVRDLSPLTAGLFFDPLSGIIAGFIGGIERYIIGTYFGIGSYTRLACSISTCLAGMLSAFLTVYLFKRKKPNAYFALFTGAVMEVFHMYMVLVTHPEDVSGAFAVVKTNSPGMITFTAIGMMLTAIVLKVSTVGWRNLLKRPDGEKKGVAEKFMSWVFGVIFGVVCFTFGFSYGLQTRAALEGAEKTFVKVSYDFIVNYGQWDLLDTDETIRQMQYHVGNTGTYYLVMGEKCYSDTEYISEETKEEVLKLIENHESQDTFITVINGIKSLVKLEAMDESTDLLMALPVAEVFEARDTQAYETAFVNIIMMSVLFVLIYLLVQRIIVDNLDIVNESLGKIKNGNLQEKVSVYNTSEFVSLSNDINQMVDALKGYIDAAEKRIEQELKLAKSIQESALPHNFTFEQQSFEIYATMNPAKQVGGDFYDFFFVGPQKLALVIADVSGKGIPAALFMMRSKAAIRTVGEKGLAPSEILQAVNQGLQEGNTEKMFVTVWLGIVDLDTGKMTCANAGHEYPLIRQAGGAYEVYKDKHAPIIGLVRKLNITEYTITLQEGDSIFVYTDGIPESINHTNEEYGLERLKEVLNTKKDTALEELLPAVLEDIQHFADGEEQFDDITMLGFRYKK